MLKHQLIHPTINEVLGSAGHNGKILIADGNYPASSTLGPNAKLVSLNLSPGVVTCTQVLEALVSAIPIEAAQVMAALADGPYGQKDEPARWGEYRTIFEAARVEVELKAVERFAFYEAVRSADHVLTIQTADQFLFANLLLTIGVRMGA